MKKCPDCNTELTADWSVTGFNPGQELYVIRCEECGTLQSERDIIDVAIRDNGKQLAFFYKVNHAWPESIDLIESVVGASRSQIASRLIANNLL